MDIYYAVTNYHLLCCVLHKLKFNKNNSILLISEYLTNAREDLVKNIKKTKIFSDVKIIDRPDFNEKDETLNKQGVEKRVIEIDKKIASKYADLLKSANNIYSCCDFDELGIYLIHNKIPYYYFEDGCGILSREHIALNVLHQRKKFIKLLKCFGNNSNVINRFGSLKDQEEGYHNPKDIDFCVKDILTTLTSKEMDQLLEIYNAKRIKMKKQKTVLLLTMHYNEILSIDQQKELYTSLIDYFTEDDEKLIIKPHPADTIDDYEKMFKGSIVLTKSMPSELFPYCIDHNFEKGITCWSTSIFGLQKLLKKIINFDTRIDKTYEDFDLYYAITMYLKKIKKETKRSIKMIDINEIQLLQMLKYYFKDYEDYYNIVEVEKADIYIANKATKELKDKKGIFLHSKLINDDAIKIINKTKEEEKIRFIELHNLETTDFLETKELKYSKGQLSVELIKKEDLPERIMQVLIEKNNQKIFWQEKAQNQEQQMNENKKEWDEKTKRLEAEVNHLKKEPQEKNASIERIYNSTSWKIIKPFRKISSLLIKKKKKERS